MSEGLNLIFFTENGNGNPRRRSIISPITTLTACAAAVAIAAPVAPRPHGPTRTRSPTIFTTHAMATNTSGIFESPRPRSIPLITLYATIKTIPAEHTATYRTVEENASSGAFIRCANGRASKSMRTVSTAASATKSSTDVPTARAAFSGLP